MPKEGAECVSCSMSDCPAIYCVACLTKLLGLCQGDEATSGNRGIAQMPFCVVCCAPLPQKGLSKHGIKDAYTSAISAYITRANCANLAQACQQLSLCGDLFMDDHAAYVIMDKFNKDLLNILPSLPAGISLVAQEILPHKYKKIINDNRGAIDKWHGMNHLLCSNVICNMNNGGKGAKLHRKGFSGSKMKDALTEKALFCPECLTSYCHIKTCRAAFPKNDDESAFPGSCDGHNWLNMLGLIDSVLNIWKSDEKRQDIAKEAEDIFTRADMRNEANAAINEYTRVVGKIKKLCKKSGATSSKANKPNQRGDFQVDQFIILAQKCVKAENRGRRIYSGAMTALNHLASLWANSQTKDIVMSSRYKMTIIKAVSN